MSLNSGSKAKENHESWESLFRKTMYKEPLFSFTKPAENPINWIHLLDPFGQQDTYKGSKSMNGGGGHKNGSASQSTQLSNLSTAGSKGSPKGIQVPGEKLPSLKIPEAVAALAQVAAKASGESFFGGSTSLPGWPLMPFSKVQMFKCEKCCLEFCSPTNHRRHLRMIHRRPVNAEKEDIRTQRQQLATFWDNLCPEAAYNIVASRNLALEDLTGEQVVKALTHLLQQPSLFALPHSYVKAGAMLLEVVQNKSSRLLLTSSELFKILDGSSERTFPSFGLDAMHRYIFEGGAGKVGLELKNLVASLGFLVELNLVKAFINNKDEEAMRCQTALVEEEAASQRKRAEIQERKRLKKIRQKESRDKDPKPLKRFPPSSDSDLTDEGNSPSGEEGDDFAYGLKSRPSSNTYENLYYRLTNEKSDTDYQEEIMSTEPSNLCKDNDHNEVGDVVITGSEVATAPEDSKSGSKKSSQNIATKKGSVVDSTDVLKSGVEQQCKYSTDYSLSSKGRFIPVPKYKESWKERKWMNSTSFRSFSKESHADDTNKKSPEMNFEEDMASANPSCTSGTIVEDPSGSTGNKSLIFRPRQYLPRPIKMKKYQPTAGMGHTVWTRKVPKSSNAVPEKMPLSEAGLPNGPSQDSGDLAVDSTVTCCSAVEVSAAAVPHGSSSGPSSISAGNVCPTFETVSLARLDSGNSEPWKVANIVDKCDCPSPSSVFPSDDLNHCLRAHIPSTTAACHSVVTGSLSVSLVDPLLDLEKSGVTDVAEVMKEVDVVPERKHTVEQLYAVGRTDIVEESLGALHENGLIQYVSHKDPERHGKDLKFSSQLDPDGKEEDHEHYTSQAGHERFTKAILVSGGNPKGGRMKMWRPVSATTSHDSSIDCLATSCSPSNDDIGKLSAPCSHTTDNTKPVLLNQTTTGWDSNTEVNISHALEAEGELSKGTQEDVGEASYAYKGTSACLLGTDVEAFAASMEQENSLVKEDSAVRSVSVKESFCWSGSSTYESVACFLSQRWTDAVNEPDSLVLSVDTGKLCPSQSCNSIVDVHGVVGIVNPKDMRKISSHSGNDAFTRNDRKSWHHGLRKQGCPGSALAVSRRFTAKDRSHLSLKSTDYRYIPK